MKGWPSPDLVEWKWSDPVACELVLTAILVLADGPPRAELARRSSWLC